MNSEGCCCGNDCCGGNCCCGKNCSDQQSDQLHVSVSLLSGGALIEFERYCYQSFGDLPALATTSGRVNSQAALRCTSPRRNRVSIAAGFLERGKARDLAAFDKFC